MKIKLSNVRLSFPNIFRRAVFNGEEGKYGSTFLLPKSEKEQADRLRGAIKAMIAEELKGAKVPADKLCMRDGDESEYAGYAEHWSIKASNNTRPLALDRGKAPLTEDDGVLYAGCHVNAIINLWAQNNQFGRRINANLLGVQFVRDGEPFGDGGRTAAVDDFDEVPWDDGDSPMF